MMTLEERAREVLAELGVDDDLDGDSLATVAEALRTVRDEALEEAAKVAETPVEDDDRIDRQVRWDVATQKPVDLIRYFIRTYSNPGDLVLDPCMGSGTTAIAAACEGRRFIGFERDPNIFEVARNRSPGGTKDAG